MSDIQNTHFIKVFGLQERSVTPENYEYIRDILVADIKLKNIKLRKYVLRIEDISISHRFYESTIECTYKKTIKIFERN